MGHIHVQSAHGHIQAAIPMWFKIVVSISIKQACLFLCEDNYF